MAFWTKAVDMTDIELTRALERGEIDNASFHHLSHLHVTWVYLSESPSVHEAATKMRDTLRKFAASAGKPEKYHETITVFWMQLLHCLRATYVGRSLEEIIRDNPRLLEKNLTLDYYSRETLLSDRARKSWLEPDLKPLPTNAAPLYSSGPTGHPSHRLVCG
jgi:hypothetical protein